MTTQSQTVATRLRMSAGPYTFACVLEEALAPSTCAAFCARLPLRAHVLHVRWSGQATWVPLGDEHFELEPENATAFPLPGQVLLYPGGVSEAELLIPYGSTRFYSVAGELTGNHFLSVVEGTESLRALGEHVLWHGALEIAFELERAE